MSLKKKLTASITMFVLVVVMAIVGVYAVTSATINMGGSISFQASGVYAQLTGGISGGNDKTFNTLLFTEADANSPSEDDKNTWNDNNLSLTKENPTRTITVTVENLSTERSMYVMIEDVGEVENITKSVTVPGNDNAANKGIEVAKGTIITYTITLSITNTNNSVNGRYEYIIHLSDEPIASKINIQAFSNNEELGTVTGGVKGVEENQEVTLIATPNETNEFLGWATEKDITNIVSIEPTYSFTYEEGIPTNYYAVFNETIEQQTIDGITYNLYKEAKLAEVVNSEGATLTGELDLSNGVWFNGEKYKIYSIGDMGFGGQEQITGVVIPKTVTKIGMLALAGTQLESVTIPSSVVEIGDGAFGLCAIGSFVDGEYIYEGTLTEINLEEGNKNYYVDIVEGKGVALISNDGKLISYANGSSLTSYTIQNNVKEITVYSIAGSSNLTEIIIPNGVTKIGDEAFISCQKLQAVTIPSSVTYIGMGAFSMCENIEEIDLGNGVKNIGDYAFSDEGGNIRVSSLVIPQSVKNIGDNSFNIEGLIFVTLKANLESVGSGRIGSNTTRVLEIGKDVNMLPDNLFINNLRHIEVIKVEEGNTTFSVKTGANGYGLYKGEELVYSLDSNIVEVGELLYRISGTTGNYQAEVIGFGQTFNKDLVIPATITHEKFSDETIIVNSIAAGAFVDNPLLETIIVGSNVTIIGTSMYEGPALRCPNLNQIILLNDLEREYDLKDHKYIWTLNDEEVLNLHFAGTYIRNI